ncbi:MAG: GNAT family N-acetyltransferase [Rhodospirillaceae bacterium]|nr:GNAT family N-acetyltransferase [Rhodospirillaceae bacterium]|tara:strand:+ start:611 stop:1111 length:501 start_codon:yes stop_codon:yes gene_type:complete
MFKITRESSEHIVEREKLLDKVFGVERKKLSTYLLRDGVSAIDELSFVALMNGKFRGSIRFWPVEINKSAKSLLLGPLAVDPKGQGKAIGVALVRKGIHSAKKLGYNLIVLVGDHDYYKRFGFEKADPLGLKLSGEYDNSRLLYLTIPRELDIKISGYIRKYTNVF